MTGELVRLLLVGLLLVGLLLVGLIGLLELQHWLAHRDDCLCDAQWKPGVDARRCPKHRRVP